MYFHRHHSDPSQAMQFLEKSLALSDLCRDTNRECNTLVSSAQIRWITGDYLTAQIYACKAQRLANLSGNLYEGAMALQIEATCSTCLGSFQDSIIQLQRAREILGICGMSGGERDYTIMTSQAEVHLQKSEYAEARSIHTQILQNTSVDQNAYSYASALLNIAEIDVIVGAAEHDVHQNMDMARLVFESYKYPRAIIHCNIIFADLDLRGKNTLSASTLFHKCLHLSWGKNNAAVSYCLERLADISRWDGTEIYWKYTWPVVYLAFAQKSKERLALHKAVLCLGDVFVSNEDEDTAHSLFTVALEGFTFMDVHHSRAQSMLRLGDLAKERGELSRAIEFWKAARPLFERSLQAKDVAKIDTRLAGVEETYQEALARLTTLNPPVTLLPQPSIEKSGTEEVRDRVEDVDEESVTLVAM
jgi:tetratricopeptide (TPR) repeat protein